ncbi:MAG: metallophosphoesterase [Candidatus Marinimicrobia bacterium]|nr:metallophosphoesterase [Candidatus Neomarinimicrobiota bacterium]
MMNRIKTALLIFFTLISMVFTGCTSEKQTEESEFRVYPHLLAPSSTGVTINWYTVNNDPGTLSLYYDGQDENILTSYTSEPFYMEELEYSELELSQETDFPDMFENRNYRHSILLKDLRPGTDYVYRVRQGFELYQSSFRTAPKADTRQSIRFITFADSETDPEGRETYRRWVPGAQAAESTGRPADAEQYLVTEFEGYHENLRTIESRQPEFLLISGDIVQGGGYQRAWDEFFFQNAGKFGDILGGIPLIPAIGNWENYGARNGEYEPWAIAAARAKYAAYFDAPPNNNPNFRNFYYRIDYGPITILTLDSSNGLPDSTDQDTNININADTYPENNLPDINPGSDQWRWTIEQLKDASNKGQVIFVQFHHIPYSSGGHSLPLTAKGSSGQAGIPMRVYTPEFQKYGVVAVFCGHNESFEHSIIDGVHFYDVGVAGDGLGYALDKKDERFENPYRLWVAHHDAEELWDGKQLMDGGKHYGHLEINVEPQENGEFKISMTPVYIFPVTDTNGKVTGFERRIYDDEVELIVRNA